MIKLIATDMDGTLLNEHGKLPDGFFNLLEDLNHKGIRFTVASGRPYPTLYENFKPYSDSLYFICDNGSYIVEPNQKPIISIIDKNIVQTAVNACKNIEGITLVLCGVNSTYYTPCNKEIENEISKYYINKELCHNPLDINDDIFKIAIYDLKISKDNSFKVLDPLLSKNAKVVVSGLHWLDINNKDINKGQALNKIQNDYNISYDETMVFGDFYNDIEMLQSAHYSFVMENANDDIKSYGNYIAKPNTEAGVIQAIKEYALY